MSNIIDLIKRDPNVNQNFIDGLKDEKIGGAIMRTIKPEELESRQVYDDGRHPGDFQEQIGKCGYCLKSDAIDETGICWECQNSIEDLK